MVAVNANVHTQESTFPLSCSMAVNRFLPSMADQLPIPNQNKVLLEMHTARNGNSRYMHASTEGNIHFVVLANHWMAGAIIIITIRSLRNHIVLSMGAPFLMSRNILI